MRSTTLLSVLALSATQAIARPAYYQTPDERGLLDSPGVLDDVLLFDAPAFPDPNNSGNTIANFQTYVSLRQIDLGVATAAITELLSKAGIQVGNQLNTVQERIKLFGSIGLPGKNVEVVVPGCSTSAKLPSTSVKDLGLASGSVSLGNCITAQELVATVVPGVLDDRKFSASVFPSPNSGFGIISDIDDTIKVSNVLDTASLLRSTFLDEPKAVSGMPQLYSSLRTSLQNPQFIYLTGSPYQFYPFLNNFIDSTYPKGPIFTQNLTILNIPAAIEFISGSNGGTFTHKTNTIDRLQTMYPQKKWLAIGDSTQKDPEVYASAFKKFPGFISCIWIRRVDNADNTEKRFNTAFADVPKDKWRVFTDSDIPSLASIGVAGGKC
ncbi:hypothetical protein H1R20_g14204, partial [Candolleomyces eurysporus]